MAAKGVASRSGDTPYKPHCGEDSNRSSSGLLCYKHLHQPDARITVTLKRRKPGTGLAEGVASAGLGWGREAQARAQAPGGTSTREAQAQGGHPSIREAQARRRSTDLGAVHADTRWKHYEGPFTDKLFREQCYKTLIGVFNTLIRPCCLSCKTLVLLL